MDEIDNTVQVTLAVDAEAADALSVPANRIAAGEMVSNMFRSKQEWLEALTRAIAGMKAEARANGLTDEEIDAELEAYNAERRTTG